MEFRRRDPKTNHIAVRVTKHMNDLVNMYCEELNARKSELIEYALQQLFIELERKAKEETDKETI